MFRVVTYFNLLRIQLQTNTLPKSYLKTNCLLVILTLADMGWVSESVRSSYMALPFVNP